MMMTWTVIIMIIIIRKTKYTEILAARQIAEFKPEDETEL